MPWQGRPRRRTPGFSAWLWGVTAGRQPGKQRRPRVARWPSCHMTALVSHHGPRVPQPPPPAPGPVSRWRGGCERSAGPGLQHVPHAALRWRQLNISGPRHESGSGAKAGVAAQPGHLLRPRSRPGNRGSRGSDVGAPAPWLGGAGSLELSQSTLASPNSPGSWSSTAPAPLCPCAPQPAPAPRRAQTSPLQAAGVGEVAKWPSWAKNPGIRVPPVLEGAAPRCQAQPGQSGEGDPGAGAPAE